MKKKTINSLFLLILFALLLVVPAKAATLYVDNTTTDCAVPIGTAYDPTTDTCGAGAYTVYTTINAAANATSAGDTVIVADGTYSTFGENTNIVFMRDTGTSGNIITIRSETKHGAIVTCGGKTSPWYGFNFNTNVSYITIQDFKIHNCAIGVFANNNNAYITLKGNEIYNVNQGISIGSGCNYAVIDSNEVYTWGIAASDQYHGVYMRGVDGTFQNNIVHDNAGNGWHLQIGGYTVLPSGTWKIINNTFQGPGKNGTDGQIVLYSTNFTNLYIENNIFYNPGTTSIYPLSSAAATNFYVRNNLVYGTNNLCTVGHGSICDTATYTNNILGTDPLFTNVAGDDYTLRAGSPATNAGRSDNAPDDDIIGTARPQGSYDDIGAYEYVIGVTPSAYYISSSLGNDDWDGESPTTPWRTSAKINSSTFIAGDSYFIMRGDTYAPIVITASGSNGSPITLGAYGTGSRPIINAVETLTGWAETTASAELTIQPTNGKDSFINAGGGGNSNYGTATNMALKDYTANYAQRGILDMDFSSLTNGVTITNATLKLYYRTYDYTNPVGKNVNVKRLTQTGWTEAGVTWNKYDGTNNWTTPGGDGDTTNTGMATAVIPASAGWVQWDVTTLAQYAQANLSEVLPMLIKFENEATGVEKTAHFNSSDHTENKPALVITYTTGGDEYKITGVTVVPLNMWFDTVLGTHTDDNDDCPTSLVNNNDWCHKASTSELYIFSATNPSGRTIERDYPYGIDVNGKDYIIIQDIEVKNAGTANIALRGDADNNIVQRCNIHDSAGDGIQVSGTTPDSNAINYNLVYDNGGDGISVESGTGTLLYNNVFYSNAGDGISIAGAGTTATLKNNISSGNTGSAIKLGAGLGVVTIDYNVYFPSTGTPFSFEGTGKNFADWKTACSCDSHSYNADPLFTNVATFNFKPTSASPVIDKGTDVGLTSDYDGVTIWAGSGYDIGAFEMILSHFTNAILLGMEF